MITSGPPPVPIQRYGSRLFDAQYGEAAPPQYGIGEAIGRRLLMPNQRCAAMRRIRCAVRNSAFLRTATFGSSQSV